MPSSAAAGRQVHPALAFALLAFLVLAYVAGYAWSASIQDTARDVYYAYAIRHGVFLPLEGPVLGGAIHLGPLWFYLLSLPLWLSDSWLAVALFAGAIAGLKFPLAYLIGERVLDRNFGVLWAMCLVIPGWPAFEQLIFFNPNAAATLVLLSVWYGLTLAGREFSMGRAAILGLIVGIAIHVHPTTGVVALGGLPLARAWIARGVPVARVALAFGLGLVLPLAPYAASQAAAGFPDLTGAGRYVGEQVSFFNALNFPRVIWASLVGGGEVVGVYFGHFGLPASRAVTIAFAAPILLVLWCAARRTLETAERRVFLWLAAGSIAFAVFAAMLRPATPVYFVFALAPILAGLVAMGVRILGRTRLSALAVLYGVCVLACYSYLAVGMASRVQRGEGVLPSRILDITHARSRAEFSETWFPAIGRSRLGRFLCSIDRAAVHGHLAYILDRSVGVDMLFACGSLRDIGIGGRAGADRHWSGMSRTFWDALGGQPECWAGSLGLARAVAQNPLAAREAVPDGRKYFPRDHHGGPATPGAADFRAPRSDAVLVSNPFHGYEALKVNSVRVDGVALQPIARNDLSELYAVPAQGAAGDAAWHVEFAASDPAHVDIVTMPKGQAMAAGCGAGAPR